MAERTCRLGLACRRSLAVFFVGTVALNLSAQQKPPPWTSGIDWPKPKPVTPAATPGGPPSDAIVLFDGQDLSAWEGGEKWTIENGYGICRNGITTKRAFGDCQLHLEWASPEEVKGEGQGRGNSGVYLMGKYEIQILDSYNNETYYDGQAGSIYKQRPPLVNASRKPGEWQSYDIIFRAPRFDSAGKLLKPAFVTILHNGVLIQDHFEIVGESEYRKPPMYHPLPAKAPLHIQYHGHPVKFRNIWIRELEDTREDLIAPLRERMRAEAGAAK
ncbi:MAG: hypothetical protein AMXMBFR13_37580 [Phycisphaerae bacterium]